MARRRRPGYLWDYVLGDGVVGDDLPLRRGLCSGQGGQGHADDAWARGVSGKVYVSFGFD